MVPELRAALHGRVLVAHHAPIEIGFLDHAFGEGQADQPPLHVVDTMTLQRRLLVRRHGEPPPGALRLDAARRRFGLPRYSAHRAATDAIATAELLLAQVAELGSRLGREPTLADLSPQRPKTVGEPGAPAMDWQTARVREASESYRRMAARHHIRFASSAGSWLRVVDRRT